MAILQIAGLRSELDASGNESDEFFGESVSSHPETVENNCRFSWEGGDTVCTFGGGTVVSFEVYDEVINGKHSCFALYYEDGCWINTKKTSIKILREEKRIL